MKSSRYSQKMSLILNVVFFDLLLLLLVVKAHSTLVSVSPTTQVWGISSALKSVCESIVATGRVLLNSL